MTIPSPPSRLAGRCLLGLCALLPMSVHAADRGAPTRNATVVRAVFDEWQAGRGSVFDLLAEDVVWTVAGSSTVSATYLSRAEFMQRAVQPISARLATPIVPALRHLVAQEDAVVVVWDGHATALDGTPYRNSYAWWMQLHEGRVVRAIAFLDTWALQSLLQPQ